MKKTILTLLCILLLNCGCYAVDSSTAQIQQLEKSYFGYDYPDDNTAKRLDRLEKAVYGQVSQKPAAQRIQRLTKDLPVIASNSSEELEQAQREELPQAEKDVKYPVVDKIEQKVFKKTYTNEDIYNRLSRLEKQVYKKESSASLNERVDALRGSVLANAPMNSSVDSDSLAIDGYDPGFSSAGADGTEQNTDSRYNYYTPQNTKNRIAQPDSRYFRYDENPAQSYDVEMLEKTVFNKKFRDEPVSRRLARLENSVFQKTFSDDEDARIQRLLAAVTAQKTAKHYDNNRLMQNLNTGIQIGGIILMVLAMIL